jgi:RNA polymerase sigma-70 factor (ECF subfamily)
MSEKFEVLYLLYQRKISKYFTARVGLDSSQDLTSEVFLIALKKIDKIKKGYELQFLYKTANLILKEFYRKEKREKERNLELIKLVIEPNLQEKDDLQSALLSLSRDELELLMLQSVDQLSTKEIAYILNISSFAVRKRLSRVKNKLKMSQI